MNQLIEKIVFIDNNEAITTSELIVKFFQKEHKHVLRDIKELNCSDSFSESNFGLTEEIRKQGTLKRKIPYYKVLGFNLEEQRRRS